MKSRDKEMFVNRELSWLDFNQRVLDEATDPTVPLLERVNFLAITGSNLDEFFMVRAGGLEILVAGNVSSSGPAGMTPRRQLSALHERAHRMVEAQYACLAELESELASQGVRRRAASELTPRQSELAEAYFDAEVFPVLTPMAVAGAADFPLLANLALQALVRLAPPPESKEERFAILPLSAGLRRFVPLGGALETDFEYMPVEDLIAMFVRRFFPGQEVLEFIPFRIARNAAMSLQDEFAADMLSEMESILAARRTSDCVRLETAARVSRSATEFLLQGLEIHPQSLYRIRGPIDLTAFRRLVELGGRESWRYPTWTPRASPQIDLSRGIFEQLAARSVLLFHPYESFDPVVRMIEEAARDPDVLAIKQVLYRTSAGSPIVSALRTAADNGKVVTVVLELKARFDEARNIRWARELEEAGVQLIYGVKGLKTHAKVCLIVRREPRGIVRYCHFGTGNYNEKTARLYSDLGFMTSDPDFGADASAFFNAICGYSEPQRYGKLDQAPTTLRDKLISLIRGEAERKRHGQKALIMAKMNALVDPQMVRELCAASQAGVEIRLSVRGTCCLRPGIKGFSENITISSVIDRYLEHARIFYFHQGGAQLMFISSADWMSRNLSRRVELMIPIEDPNHRRRLRGILETCLADNVKSRHMLPDGSFRKPPVARGSKAVRSQEVFYKQAVETAEETLQARRRAFEPHRPTGEGRRRSR